MMEHPISNCLKACLDNLMKIEMLRDLSSQAIAGHVGTLNGIADKFLAALPSGEIRWPSDDGSKRLVVHPKEELEAGADALRLLARDHYPSLDALQREMAFVYGVAVFDAFLADVVATVLELKPELLKSRRQVSMEQVIEAVGSGRVVRVLAQREVTDFAYLSVFEQAKYLDSKFNIDLAQLGISLDTLSEIMARRNIFVHSGGIVNERYLSASKSSAVVGSRLQVDDNYLKASHNCLSNCANRLSEVLVEKFPVAADQILWK